MGEFAEYVAKAARAAGYDIDAPRGGGRTALAKDTGISLSSISRLLSGRSTVEAKYFKPLAEAIGVDIEDLLSLAGLMDGATGDAASAPQMAAVSAEVVAKIRARRQLLKISAQKLADGITALGFPVTRTMLANWEGERRNTVPVDFLVLAAQVLGSDAAEVLREPIPLCPTCKGEPPTGFTCNTCGGEAS